MREAGGEYKFKAKLDYVDWDSKNYKGKYQSVLNMNGLLFLLLLPKHYNVVPIYITLGITNDIKVIFKRQEDRCRVYPSAFFPLRNLRTHGLWALEWVPLLTCLEG